MNKIEIPRKVFEQMFQNGGEKYAQMTDQVLGAVPEHAEDQANAEIEGGEHVKTNGTVKKAEGETHENGGIPVKLNDGDRVLSDHLKVGAELAKQLSKAFDIKVKATDTYAKALDKHLKKIGHTEATEEMAGYIEKLDKQNTTVKDEATLALNSEALMDKIKEHGTKLQELETPKQQMFDLLFQAQEDSKAKETKGNVMQEGGTIQDLMQKYNISEDRLKELLPQFQVGGDVPPSIDKYAGAVAFGQMMGQIPKYTPEQKAAIKQYYSTVVKDEKSLAALNERLDKDELVFNQNLLQEIQQNKDIPLQLQHATQKEKELYGVQTENRLKDYLYSSDFERKFNRPFGSQPNDEALIYDEIISGLEKEGIKYEGSPTTFKGTKLFGNVNAGQPKVVEALPAQQEYTLDVTKYKNSTPEQQAVLAKQIGTTKEAIDAEAGKVTTGFINFKPAPQPLGAPTEVPVTATEAPLEMPVAAKTQTEEERRRLGLMLFPERFMHNPEMLAPAKFQPIIYSGERVEISPEQALNEINRAQLSTQNQIATLPDSQRAATLASMDANNAAAISKVTSETERYNAKARERESYENAKVKTEQSLSDARAASQYQTLMGRELESFQQDLQSQENIRFQDRFGKWSAINQYNRNNAANPDITFLGDRYEVNTPQFSVSPDISALTTTEEKKKPKKKNGGRFKK